MKLLIYIFLISINYCLSDVVDENAKKIVVKSYPKKVKPGMYILNKSGNYVKPKPIATKKHREENSYTVFSNVQNDKSNVPDSPYFPVEKIPEQKPRVKKVLPDYKWHTLRHKRSVDPKNKADSNVRKKALRQDEIVHVSPPIYNRLKGNVTKNLPAKPGKDGKRPRVNKNIKRKRRNGKRKLSGKRPRRLKLRNGLKKNRNLKYTKKPHIRNQNRAKLRSRFGDKQALKLTKDRRNFMNMTKKSKKGARRLIAARDAMIEEYPYVVSIQKEREHWCAGALLNPRLVITTANCMWKGHRVSRMHVRAGSRHTDRGGQVAYIQEVMKHPGWKIRNAPDHDVALVLLDRNIKFSHGLHGVELPNRVMLPAFEDAWITSWGSERRDGVYETKGNTLQVYHARLMARPNCNNVTQRFGVTVTENFICLAQTGKRAPCTRDTGAPAVSDGVLWGLASWGIRKLCGTERFPAMFSYLGAQTNLDFIINATHYLMSDERFYPFPDRAPMMRAMSTIPPVETLPY